MTYLELKKRAAKELNLLDNTEEFLVGRDINETRLGQSINDAYLHDIVGALSEQYPFMFRMESTAPNYTNASTIDSFSGTTIVAATSVFTNGMVGNNIYNSTKQALAVIESYTSATSVVLDADYSADWDAGDNIYILDQAFVFGGDSTDYIENLSLWVRYSPTGVYYPAEMKLKDDMFKTPYDTYNEERPCYMLSSFDVSGQMQQGFKLMPLFTEHDDKALKMDYLQMPGEMTNDSDTPKLPLNHQAFLFWKAVEEGYLLRKDVAMAQYAQSKYEQGRARLMASFKPLRNMKPKRDIMTHFKYIKNRDY